MGNYFSEHTGAEQDLGINEELNNQPKSNYVWDDFDFNVNNLRVSPATSKPDFDQVEGEYLFDDASVETVIGNKISKHSFKLGEVGLEWRPHVHWVQAADAVVVWQLEYKFWAANTTEPASYTTLTTTAKEFTYTSGSLHQISEFSPIDMSSNSSTAFHVKVRISRLGDDASDTYVGDVRFLGFDFHVPIDQLGSRQEFIK